MGTRHLIIIFQGGQYRLAQFGRFDGHPTHTGRKVLKFLRDPSNISKLVSNLPKLRFATEEEIVAITDEADKVSRQARRELAAWSESTKHPRSKEDSLRFKELNEIVQNGFPKNMSALSDWLGYDVLPFIANAEDKILVANNLPFISDRIFCEWAYVIDIDSQVLEVYSLFAPTTGEASRFDGVEGCEGSINFAASYKFDSLPQPQDEREFIEKCGDSWQEDPWAEDSEEDKQPNESIVNTN